MPPKKQIDAGSESSVGSEAKSTTSTSGVVTMTNEQFQTLLSEIRSVTVQGDSAPSPLSNIVGNAAQTQGSFAKCSARFDGNDHTDVDAFLDNIETFKECTNVSDENALRGLTMLFEGIAATWWQGVKKTVLEWNQAVTLIRDSFSKKLPPAAVFREIFAREQHESETTELFVCHIRALLAQLPYLLGETVELDMVYGLLKRKVRKRISRSECKNFKDLLCKAREVEQALAENSKPGFQEKVTTTTMRPIKERRMRCNYCKNFGHLKEDCDKLKKRSSTDNSGEETRKTSLVCYGCGAPNVIRANCTTCREKSKDLNVMKTAAIDFWQTSTHSSGNEFPARPVVDIVINGLKGLAFVDTGAHASIGGARLYKLLKEQDHIFTSSQVNISYADGIVKEETVLRANVEIQLANTKVDIILNFLPHLENNKTLLGVDFIEKVRMVIDVPNKSWHFCEDPDTKYVFVGEYSYPDVVNVFEISKYCLQKDEGESLDATQRVGLDVILKKYEDVFEPGGGPTGFAVHNIKTVENAPVAVAPYQMSDSKKEYLRKELDRLLQDEIIEECESPWASPVILVPKKDGTFRLCVDYRKLNAVTVPDTYPMPKIEDLLNTTKRTPYMSTIDLQSGFWQVPVNERDKDKTSFTTPFGIFRFNRMPFGLRNAPATFVRLMDRFRAGLKDRSVFSYVDDIIVLSETYEKHLEDLCAVFERLRLFNLRARRDKCKFVRDEIKYVGHVITSRGIKADPDKIAAIVDLNPPSNVKQVQSFVQTCSWFRKFIPDFAGIARPLTNLLKKNQSFHFGEPELHAFSSLKQKLIEPPILVQANPKEPYILRTDASGFALGAVLLQLQGDDEKPIGYASRLLTQAEKNYSTIEREALAVVWSAEKFRSYLEGRAVTIITDHQPLQWLFSIKSPMGRIARWALRIQGLDMKITYTPGKLNRLADLLSRPFCLHEDSKTCHLCVVSVDMPTLDKEDFRNQQSEDPEVQKIRTALENGPPEEIVRWTDRGFYSTNGILYHCNPEFEEPQLVIPAQCRENLLKDFHDAPSAGHYGVERTLQKIARKYYFTGMRRYITNYVRNCVNCQKYKASNLKPAGLLQTPAPAQRFEVISVDLFGPLPETQEGNRWIFIVEDLAAKWTEIFAVKVASAEVCAKLMIDEIFLRYGTPRRIVSDNGTQFISDIMQKVSYCFGIKLPFIPAYHPESNPVERKNRDMKEKLSILVQNRHFKWDEHIASIRFALNSTVTESTGKTPAFLTFGREMRAPYDAERDFREVVKAENFVPRITPYLTALANVLCESREILCQQQDRRKEYADQKRRSVTFCVGDKVLLKTHSLSNTAKGFTSKFAPKRDGPYVVSKVASPTTYCLKSSGEDPQELGRYHVSDLTPFRQEGSTNGEFPSPIIPKRNRGRPRKNVMTTKPMTSLPKRKRGRPKKNVGPRRNP